jgi:hypothetical protein
MSRVPWKSPLHIEGDWVKGDICAMPSCRREPKNGAKYCDPCREEREAYDDEECIHSTASKRLTVGQCVECQNYIEARLERQEQDELQGRWEDAQEQKYDQWKDDGKP